MAGLECASLVPVVLSLVSFCYLSFFYTIIYKWLGTSIWGLFHFCLLNTLWPLLVYNYYLASTTDPGLPPPDYQPENLKEASKEDVDDFARVRECRHCHAYKPPRCHHCSDCSRCVLKMDHHCIWINNCVGHLNHKAFLLFLFYISLEALHMTTFSALRIVDIFIAVKARSDVTISGVEAALLAVQLIILFPTMLSVCGLFIYQMMLVSANTTVIESLEIETKERKARREGKTFFYPYDLGRLENIRSVLGNDVLAWFWMTKPKGDGVTWRVRRSHRDIDIV